MDDLLAYLIEFFGKDALLTTFFQAAGQDGVLAAMEGGDRTEVYPRIAIKVDEGGFQQAGDINDDFMNGVCLIIVYAKDNTNTTGAEIGYNIEKRCMYLMVGDRTEESAGIRGTLLPTAVAEDPDKWKVCVCRMTSPSGKLTDPDPLVYKHQSTFRITLGNMLT